ncbi:hypothetical protein ACFSSA_06960 [Luteolibacter algae]|uniref:Uncharacterized protein n=1 Tax=Luteolibacter algae TaxID=454151 RepID=A0ABW5D6B7_9BACT
MKLFLILIGMVAAGFLGYSFEPQLRQQLTGKSPSAGMEDAEAPDPEKIVINTTAPSSTIDPASYSADQLPEKIQLKSDAEVSNENGDLKMTITAGNKVNLIRLEGQNVVISPGAGPFEGTVPISQTDLIEQLTALGAAPKAEADMTVDEPVAEEPEKAETESNPVPKAPSGPVDIVAVMQSSIKNGEIKEFTFDKVLDWSANEEPETIDGESYQTGIASYKAETVFGVKTIQAKALIKDGAVVRWLWPKSGLEIE